MKLTGNVVAGTVCLVMGWAFVGPHTCPTPPWMEHLGVFSSGGRLFLTERRESEG